MKLFQTISLTLLASALTAAAAAPRFAVVRVKDVYSELPSTAALQEELRQQRDDIMKDQRAEQLRKIISELQTLQAQLSDKNSQLDDATKRKLARTYEIKRQEAQTLQQDFEGYKAEQEKAITRKMVASMRDSLNRIVKSSEQVARERGYDGVFDSSGNTNSGVPFVVFNKNAPDLTADIQAALRDSEPAPAILPANAPAVEKN